MAFNAFGQVARGVRLGGSTFGALKPPKGIGNLNPPRIRGLNYQGPGALGAATPAYLEAQRSAQGNRVLRPSVPQADAGQSAQGNRLLHPGVGTGTTGGPPGGTPGAKPPAPAAGPPLDAISQANIAARIAANNQKITGVQLGDAYATTQLQAALAQLAYQQPRQSLQLEQQANARGGLYSSVYDQQLGNLNYDYAGRQGGLVSNYTGKLAGDLSNIAGLESDELTYAGQQAAGSAERASQKAATNPATGNGGGGGKTKTKGGGGSSTGSGSGGSGKINAPRSDAQQTRVGAGALRSTLAQRAARASAQANRTLGNAPKGSKGGYKVPKVKVYGGVD